jgi:nitrite reductase/ring-hydroxylating ferredoxin subunit
VAWIKVLEESALGPEGRQVVEVEGQKVFLLNHDGHIYAMLNSCPHMGGNLSKGTVTDQGKIVCPWHHSVFDLKTGEVEAWTPSPPVVGPILGMLKAKHAMTTFPTKVDEGAIWIDVG